MKLLNVSPFKVGRRYKSVDSDFWFEVLSIAAAGTDRWKMEYAYKDTNGVTGKTDTHYDSYLVKYYVEVPKDETVE